MMPPNDWDIEDTREEEDGIFFREREDPYEGDDFQFDYDRDSELEEK